MSTGKRRSLPQTIPPRRPRRSGVVQSSSYEGKPSFHKRRKNKDMTEEEISIGNHVECKNDVPQGSPVTDLKAHKGVEIPLSNIPTPQWRIIEDIVMDTIFEEILDEPSDETILRRHSISELEEKIRHSENPEMMEKYKRDLQTQKALFIRPTINKPKPKPKPKRKRKSKISKQSTSILSPIDFTSQFLNLDQYDSSTSGASFIETWKPFSTEAWMRQPGSTSSLQTKSFATLPIWTPSSCPSSVTPFAVSLPEDLFSLDKLLKPEPTILHNFASRHQFGVPAITTHTLYLEKIL